MTKHQAIRAIRQELDYINQMIDLKIIKGLPYSRESRRHRALMSQLNRLSPHRSIFSRMFSLV